MWSSCGLDGVCGVDKAPTDERARESERGVLRSASYRGIVFTKCISLGVRFVYFGLEVSWRAPRGQLSPSLRIKLVIPCDVTRSLHPWFLCPSSDG